MTNGTRRRGLRRQRIMLAAVLAAGLLPGCGGGSSPSGPSSGDNGGGSDPAITITITSTGVSPKQLTVSQGTRVLFTNNDLRVRDMDSDPHPDHGDCVEINAIGFINPGQTKQTGNLNTIRTCGYHDHGNPDDNRFKGQIIIR